jgi:gliding motility-associated lipoprotein GldD
MRKIFIFSILILSLFTLLYYFLLRDPAPAIPKPIGYYRIDLPKHDYREFTPVAPFSIPVSAFAKVEILDRTQNADSCRFNIYYPRLKARVHCTFLSVKNNIDQLVADAYTFASKHEIKASAIEREMIDFPDRNVFGIQYRIEGEAASPLQLFLTDSTSKFLRCALYFETAPNPDSIAPVYQYIERDIQYLTEHLKWR